LDSVLERLGSKRVRRSLETDVRIAELGESEVLWRLPVNPLEEVGDAGACASDQTRRELIEHADPERHPADAQERSSIDWFFHDNLRLSG
jgi:hypothetical protein